MKKVIILAIVFIAAACTTTTKVPTKDITDPKLSKIFSHMMEVGNLTHNWVFDDFEVSNFKKKDNDPTKTGLGFIPKKDSIGLYLRVYFNQGGKTVWGMSFRSNDGKTWSTTDIQYFDARVETIIHWSLGYFLG